jgi:crossover junction endodeoxyribonuclease RuvC
MRVIGIDPGSLITGYGVVEKNGGRLLHVDNGCLTTKRKSSLPDRLLQIYESLMETIEQFQPQAIAIEEIFFSKNVASALKLGESRGIALLAATQKKIPIFEYSTRVVKQAITGYGQASKEQIQQMVQRLLKLPEIAQVDASDALALAICHLNSYKLKEALK